MTSPFLYCPGCDTVYGPRPGLFSCPMAGDGREHILDPRMEPSPELARALQEGWRAHPEDPLLAFAAVSTPAHIAGDDVYPSLVAELQDGLARFEGRPVRVSPLLAAPELARAAGIQGFLAVKDETGQPGGSHKVRHLAQTLLFLEACRHSGSGRSAAPGQSSRTGSRAPGDTVGLGGSIDSGGPAALAGSCASGGSVGLAGPSAPGGPVGPAGGKPELAISSCGNAALAAACVARAGGYRLTAFVPQDVHPEVAALLVERGAVVSRTPRLATGGGDPCYLAFREAVRAGAVPFSCTGRDNWTGLEGGRALAFETAMQWQGPEAAPRNVVLQVGGGMLARGVAQGFEMLHGLGLIPVVPRIHVCQSGGAYPFVRAWLTLLADAVRALGQPFPEVSSLPLAGLPEFLERRGADLLEAVRSVRQGFDSPAVSQALRRAAQEPARHMRPWDGPAPASAAHGILDDETYDWLFLAQAALRSGGLAVVVPEPLIVRAQALALTHTPVPVSATGSAGLAGLMALNSSGAVAPHESAVLFFTGINR